jgi:TRAP-type C4-dicarboxylate transport system permease small subunit
MRDLYVRLMGWLQKACLFWCGVSIVAMTILIFTGVVMRYGFSTGARFAEPMSIFFAVQLTMYGAAACYRSNLHLKLTVFVGLLPDRLARAVALAVHLLLGLVALVMITYGFTLAQTTWFQSYPEFTAIRVGVVYAAIPISGVIFLLFIIEHLLFGQQGTDEEAEEIKRAVAHAEEEAGKPVMR